MPLPIGWHDDGVALHNPINSNIVKGGIRNHILSAQDWPEWNVPLENEEFVTQLEESNPALGDGWRQVFRDAQIEVQKSTGRSLEGWMGQELLFVRDDRDAKVAALSTAQSSLDAANKKIADLEAQLAAGGGSGIPPALQQAINDAVSSAQSATPVINKIMNDLNQYVK